MSLPRHEHAHAHLCVVLAGSYEERLGQRSLARERLDAVWYPAGVDHAERHGPRGHHLILDVDERHTDGLPRDVRALQVPGALGAALRLAASLRDRDADDELDRRALTLELLGAARGPARPRRTAPAWPLTPPPLTVACTSTEPSCSTRASGCWITMRRVGAGK